VILTYKIRVQADSRAHRQLSLALEHSRLLYNAALEERIGAWRSCGKRLGLYDQYKALTELRRDISFAEYPVTLQRWPLKRLDLAFKGFLSRVAKGQAPGFPRFRSAQFWRTFGFSHTAGWKLTGRRLYLRGVGALRLKPHRPLDLQPKSLSIKCQGRRWFALISYEVSCEQVHAGTQAVGLDLGLTDFAVLSNGEIVANPREERKRHAKAVRIQQDLARAKRGSKARERLKLRYARLRQKETNARNTFLHQTSARIARTYATIAVEALQVANLRRSAKGTPESPGRGLRQKAGLNRSIADAGWGQFIKYLTYKAERAGGSVVQVNPAYTSQDCSGCGHRAPKPLAQREHVCSACGLRLGRDENAARNILARGVVVPAGRSSPALEMAA
jgi:putative transposase